MAHATDKQHDLILTLINRLEGESYRFLSQVRGEWAMSGGQIARMTAPEASAIIDQLKDRIAERDRRRERGEEPEPAAAPAPTTGALPADQAIASLGRKLRLTTANSPDGFVVTVDSIMLAGKNHVPSLSVRCDTRPNLHSVPLSAIGSWQEV